MGKRQREYSFTREQLAKLLAGTIEMFQEYRDVHGKSESDAKPAAAQEALEGLDAEHKLWIDGELGKMTSQRPGMRAIGERLTARIRKP